MGNRTNACGVVSSEAVRTINLLDRTRFPGGNVEPSEALQRVPDSRYLYEFGLSQDDPATELRALDLRPEDHLLCIAGAGELPLSILAHGSLLIDAVDISIAQLQLSKLKLAAVLALDTEEAARFLGYITCDRENRLRQFSLVSEYLDESGRRFWQDHLFVFKKGPVHYGRYERYIARLRQLVFFLLGGHEKLYGLFECGDCEAQGEYFDHVIRSGLLERLFKIIFHPRFYKQRTISGRGFIPEGESDIAQFFFNRFRNFCTKTLVRKNYSLQFSLLGKVLYYEALPDFLQDKGMAVIRLHYNNIHYRHISYTGILRKSEEGTYNKFALSNVGDWLNKEAFAGLLQLIADKADSNSKALLRYIYHAYPVPDDLGHVIIPDPEHGEELLQKDRFPFYNLMPMDIRIREEVAQER